MSNKDILILSIMTFITVVVWTVFEALHTSTTSTVPKSLLLQIEPLDPKLPKSTVDKLKNRISEISIPTPISTNSASQITPSPTATNSASL